MKKVERVASTWRAAKYGGPERRKKPRWRPRPFRVLLVLLGLVAAGYAAASLYVMRQETRIVFQAVQALGEDRPAFAYEQVDLPRPDGARQFAWVMRHRESDDGPWVVYLHGNPSTIASHVNISHYRVLRDLGLGVLAPEYRGFGGLEGVPTEAALLADARAAYEYLRNARKVAASRIIIYGWSLGSAVAVDLSAEVQTGALILEGAPASIADITQQRYPMFPIRLLMRSPFHSIRKIDRISSPMLFLHSTRDEAVPLGEGRRLFEAARTDKVFVEVGGGHVNAIEVDEKHFSTAIRTFLGRHGLLTPVENAGRQGR
jgi:fermentation-respiration switch protein FrsA (DUF1100 family)